MTKKLELYKCDICKNIVEVVLEGEGTLVCCNESMTLMKANTTDASSEKHVPVIEEKGEEKTVRVGLTPHPMEDGHYIQFIEVISNDEKYIKRKYLHPHEEPMVRFKCECAEGFGARELCNLHGLWATSEM